MTGRAGERASPAAAGPAATAAAGLSAASPPTAAAGLSAASPPAAATAGLSAAELSKLETVASKGERFAPAFTPLKWTSLFHSCVYSSLLICAFALGKPQPETFVLGWTHGLLWIGMSLACITAARMRIVSLRLAVAVAVLGGIGPFFGSYEFIRAQRARPSGGRRASTRRRGKSETPASAQPAAASSGAPNRPPARGSASQSR